MSKQEGTQKFLLLLQQLELTDDEKIDIVAARVLKKYRKAFEELAK